MFSRTDIGLSYERHTVLMLRFALFYLQPGALAALILFMTQGTPVYAQSLFSLTKQSLAICEYSQWGVDGPLKIAYLIAQIRLLYGSQSSFSELSTQLLTDKNFLKNDCTGKTPGISAYEVDFPPWTSSFRIDLVGLTYSECSNFAGSAAMATLLNTRRDGSANDGSMELIINGVTTTPNHADKICVATLKEKPPIIPYFIMGRNVVSFITR